MQEQMSENELTVYLSQQWIAVIGTTKPNGTPHAAPVWYEYDSGLFYCFTPQSSVKIKNLTQNDAVTLCITGHERPYSYVIVEGKCEIQTQGVSAKALSITNRYLAGAEAEKFSRNVLENSSPVLLVITPSRILAPRNLL